MKYWYSLLLLLLSLVTGRAQDPLRFKAEVTEIVSRVTPDPQKNPILFTGSSSIRMWSDLPKEFPEDFIVNTGFGGSHMSDLLYWIDQLILPYNPKMIFIYEGDNDLAKGVTSEQVLKEASAIMARIRVKLGNNPRVCFITPKPSLVRWHLRSTYETYITSLKAWASTQKNVVVIDVWSPMLDENGSLQKDLFLDDGLHMNAKGYAIWKSVIAPHIK